MSWPSFEDFCEKRLQLDVTDKWELVKPATFIVTEWNERFPEQRNHREEGDCDLDLFQLAAVYLEEIGGRNQRANWMRAYPKPGKQ